MNNFGVKVVTIDYDRRRRKRDPNDDLFFHKFEKQFLTFVQEEDVDEKLRNSPVIIGGDQVFNKRWNSNILEFLYRRRTPIRNVFSFGTGMPGDHKISQDIIRGLGDNIISLGTREKCKNIKGVVHTTDPCFLIGKGFSDIAINQYGKHGTVRYMYAKNSLRKELSYSIRGENYLLSSLGDNKPADPRVFIGLFQHADTVITDSFHAFVFSLIFEVPEVVLTKIDYRHEELIKMFNVKFEGNHVSNYDEVRSNIDKWVKKSESYIRYCMNEVHENEISNAFINRIRSV